MTSAAKSNTRDQLLALIAYDADTGEFTRRSDGQRLGFWESVARRLCISVDGSTYVAARLAWLIVHGDLPAGRLKFK